jgi:hypothetical protein
LTFSRLRAIIILYFWSLFQDGLKKDDTVLRMGKAAEQRAEKRLCYRWHARFALSPKQKPLSGQMVDISSKGMALLYHNDESCPGTNQLITTNFGVPYFDSGGSFDTVFFNRIGRVCRIDNLTSKVNRIAIQFAEPLFFKPGEQNISDSDVKQRLEAKAQLIAGAKGKTTTKKQSKAGSENQIKSYAEEIARFYGDALAGAEERIRSYAEAKARAEEKAKAQSKERAKAEAKAKSEARLRAKAEKKAAAESEKRAKIEAELRKMADLYTEQLTKIKAETAKEITNARAEYKPEMNKKKTTQKKDKKDKAKRSGEGILMDKVDKFITSRNRIF